MTQKNWMRESIGLTHLLSAYICVHLRFFKLHAAQIETDHLAENTKLFRR